MSTYKEPPSNWRNVQPPILPCDDCDATGERVRHHGPFAVTPVDCETCKGRGWLCANGCALDACECEDERMRENERD